MVLKQQEYFATVDVSKYDEALAWAQVNCQSLIRHEPSWYYKYIQGIDRVNFYFSDENDLIIFALKWS